MLLISKMANDPQFMWGCLVIMNITLLLSSFNSIFTFLLRFLEAKNTHGRGTSEFKYAKTILIWEMVWWIYFFVMVFVAYGKFASYQPSDTF